MSIMDRLVGGSGESGRPANEAPPATVGSPSVSERERPLEATWKTLGAAGGWRIRLPVRAEDVQVVKHTVVAERVLVQIRRVENVARVTETVRHEELGIEDRTVSDSDETVRWSPASDQGSR